MNLEQYRQRSLFVSEVKEHQSSEDILTINVLQKELTSPAISEIYREEIQKRISQIENPPPKPLQ